MAERRLFLIVVIQIARIPRILAAGFGQYRTFAGGKPGSGVAADDYRVWGDERLIIPSVCDFQSRAQQCLSEWRLILTCLL